MRASLAYRFLLLHICIYCHAPACICTWCTLHLYLSRYLFTSHTHILPLIMSVRLGMRCVNIFFPISYIRAESPRWRELQRYNPRPHIYTPWRCTGTGRPERAGAPDPERSDRFLGRFRSSARTCAKKYCYVRTPERFITTSTPSTTVFTIH